MRLHYYKSNYPNERRLQWFARVRAREIYNTLNETEKQILAVGEIPNAASIIMPPTGKRRDAVTARLCHLAGFEHWVETMNR